MAAARPSFEPDDSRINREIEEGSAAVRFTTVNGNRGVPSPSQHISFRPDPAAFSEPPHQHALSRQPAPQERKHKPLFVESDEGRGAYHDDANPGVHSPENHSNHLGKRKRSTDVFLKISPDFTSPPTRREEILRPPVESRSPARSLPPLVQFREDERQHAREQTSGWRQQRLSPGNLDMHSSEPLRRDSHMHQNRNDHPDGSHSPQPETDLQSDQESELQHDSLSARKGPAQRRRFSQRTKTGCHTCRRRKKKCDEAKPYCQNCTRGNFTCEGYGPKNELNVKLLSKTIPLQAKTTDSHGSLNRQSAPGAPAEHWLEAQRRFSQESRMPPFDDGSRYAQPNGMRTGRNPDYEPSFLPDRFGRTSFSDTARAPPPSSRFGGMSAPSIVTDTNGSTLSHGSTGRASNGLGSAFDTPRAMMTNRLGLNPPTTNYPFPGIGEKENMLNGRPFRHFTDPLLISERERCQDALYCFNDTSKPPRQRYSMDQRMNLFRQIIQPDHIAQKGDPRIFPIGTIGDRVLVETPFKCEYGYNINLGDDVVIQAGCVMYDPCTITIGRGTIVGPNVKFHGLGRSLDARERNGSQGRLIGGKITIEEDCYIGGNVTIMCNVTIRRESVIDDGTVVREDVRPGVVVAGNPMRIIQEIGSRPDDEYHAQPHAEPMMMGNMWPDRFETRPGRMLMRE